MSSTFSEHREDAAGEGDEGDEEARGAGEVLCTEAERDCVGDYCGWGRRGREGLKVSLVGVQVVGGHIDVKASQGCYENHCVSALACVVIGATFSVLKHLLAIIIVGSVPGADWPGHPS